MIQGISPAISAIDNLGKRIGNVANNVANVSTSGYKKSQTSASSLPTYNVSTASGTSQVGMGSALGDISQIFQQGAFEPNASPTSMAIGGDGFFVVQDGEGRSYYTREGNFSFNQAGILVNSQGFTVQGWRIDPGTGSPQGSSGDISMTQFTSPPEETTAITQIINLNSGAANHSPGANGLSSSWDGAAPNKDFIPDQRYEYQTTSKIYDSLGAAHDMSIYYDKADTDSTWEFLITVNPAEDKRMNANGENKGLLARGVMQFGHSGEITDMSLEVNDGAGNWTPQDLSSDLRDGHFRVTPDFLGDANNPNPMAVQLNFGVSYNGNNWVKTVPTSTQYAAASSSMFSASDGFNAGELESISVNPEGVITGNYTNGNQVELFQVATAKFQNPNGLEKLGNNLFAETRDSGAAITGSPGTGGLGRIVPNALEMSNVDLVQEFTNLTLFKRNFQANLKVIEVENELKGDVINIIS